jgi:uncharacterized membrane protein
MPYHVGDNVRITTTFTNLSGTATNPTAVTCSIKSPAGTITTPTPVNSGTGVYYVDLALSLAGDWDWYIAGTGAVAAAYQGIISVEAARIP